MTKDCLLNFYNEEDLVFIDGFDEAIVGVSNDMRVVYSTSVAIEILIKNNNMNLNEAISFGEYNLFFSFYDKSPIWIYDTFPE